MAEFVKLTPRDVQERMLFVLLDSHAGICLYYSHVRSHQGFFLVDKDHAEFIGTSTKEACNQYNTRVLQEIQG